jgi:hypothetical protein
MAVKEKWITYYKLHHSSNNEVTTTKLEGEHIGLKSSWQTRPATDEEIAEEKAKREQKEFEASALKAFQSRPDYIAAMAIRNVLEWISPVDHPLDRLTVEQWEELRKKLTGETS